MKRATAPSMKHVAREAQVSTMTVSLALRHDPRIRAETRERVLAAAAKLGYRPNPLVAALMAGLRGWHPRGRAAHIIAYVESYPADATPQQVGSLRRFRDGATACAASHGYQLQVFQMNEAGMSESRLESVLRARGIRGVVFAPFPKVGTTLELPWKDYAMAALGFSLARPPIHRAVNHHMHSLHLAVGELLKLGYRRVGFVMSRHEDSRVERNWMAAVLLYQYEHAKSGLEFPVFSQMNIERSPVRRWVRDHRVEVVVSTDGNVRAMLPPGPPRVGFVHLHLTPAAEGCSGIDQNNEQVGAAAVELVVGQLHVNRLGFPENPKTVLIEGRWVPGTTACGPRPRARAVGRERAIAAAAESRAKPR